MLGRLFCFLFIGLLACTNGNNKNYSNRKIQTVYEFLENVEKKEYDLAFDKLNRGVYDEKWRSIINHKLERTRSLISEYDIPSSDKWTIEIDTLHPIIKKERIVVPLFDKANKLKASLRFEFDYTGIYLPDSIIADFALSTSYKNIYY